MEPGRRCPALPLGKEPRPLAHSSSLLDVRELPFSVTSVRNLEPPVSARQYGPIHGWRVGLLAGGHGLWRGFTCGARRSHELVDCP